jgi:hypothetical protein
MRPTVQEQLAGTCRILETVVAPCVADPLARTLLDGLVANLRMLTTALPAIPGFLRADNEASAQLLAQLQPSLDEGLRQQIERSLDQAEPDAADWSALQERNGQLRQWLAQAVCSPTLSPQQHQAITTYMSWRASRVPMRYVATAPAPPLTAKT